MPIFAIGMPSAWELGVVLLIVLVIFGPGKLPQVFKSIGQGLKSFRDAQKDGEESVKDVTREIPSGTEDAHEVKTKEFAEG